MYYLLLSLNTLNYIPRLLAMNLSREQVAEALAISVEEVRRVIGNN
jgi:predicted transposase YdaD